MTNHHTHNHRSIDRSPLTSFHEREFMEGNLDAASFLRSRHEVVERSIQEEVARDRLHDTQLGAMAFGTVGAIVYLILAAALLTYGAGSAAIAAAVGIGHVALVILAKRALGRSSLTTSRSKWTARH